MPDFPLHRPSFSLPAPFQLRARDKILDLSRPVLMGILNLSQDSFYASSRSAGLHLLEERATRMLSEGAAILDLGALSSRPGSAEISEEEEKALLLPGLRHLRSRFPEALISVDVFRDDVAGAALEEGADIINNIHGVKVSDAMLSNMAKHGAACVLMHSRGDFSEMHQQSSYGHVLTEVTSALAIAIHRARQAGVTDVIADPGFGFSKSPEQNYALFRGIDYLQHMLACPLLVGVSRKSMIYKRLNSTPEEALNGTSILHMAALMQGAHLLRVHDVKEAREAIQLFQTLCSPEL